MIPAHGPRPRRKTTANVSHVNGECNDMALESSRRSTDRASLAVAGLLLLSLFPVIGGVVQLGEVPATAGTRPVVSSVAAVAHIIGMTVYCLLGAFQFSPALRRRHRWHRAAGRLLLPTGFVAASSGAWLALFFTGPLDQLPLAMVRLVFAAAMILFLSLGTAALARRDFVRHGEWMTRAYAIGVGNGTQALVVILWTVPLGDVDAWGETWLVTAGTLITAVVAEVLVRRRDRRRGRAGSARAALVS